MDREPGHRRLRAAAAALILAAAGAAFAVEPRAATPAEVNAASRLAMLAERIAKLHAQLGREVLVARSRRALTDSLAEFERGLRDVSAAAPGPEIRDNYRLLRLLWDEYRIAAGQPPTPENGRKLAERNEEVAWIAGKGARLLAPQPRARATELAMAAGNARAAAVRLAKLHLQRGWAFPAAALGPELEAAEAEVRQALLVAQAAAETDEALASELRVAEGQLAFLKHAAGQRNLEHVAKSGDNIAEVMDRVARAYASVSSSAGD